MKKILFILIALVCAVTACTKEQMISDLPEDINKPEGGTTGATKAKRGVCQSTNTLDFGQKLVDLKANVVLHLGARSEQYGRGRGVRADVLGRLVGHQGQLRQDQQTL